MKRVLIYFVILIALYSCTSSKMIANKKYVFKGVYGVYFSMEINQDATFKYYWKSGLNSGSVAGYWRQLGNKLLITSKDQAPKPIEVEESYSVSSPIIINVKSFDQITLPYVLIIINDKLELQTDENGHLELSDVVVNKIDITYARCNTISYIVKNKSSNIFNIMYDDTISPKIYFMDNKVKIRKDKLILIDENDKRLKLKRVV